ncbi:pentatricopeptide repeat-containing protein At3g22150, chloroplastic-like [Durio zibethinus]|uniref:Pentatricopeptide repeat-containing protein At3g22150, chloroplastic-like n=1 Tax=Durio zibethinus TaxID=66656 RepID=A0A6P6B3K6_DURZI|nr:pentatricopeptide repeat-containing protein At3g22150, chloroplastic-like [Durio zibethinus]XP_022771783.1 pentatricopeptide repeat-containing protein At3g22150, chloroplastic-like [Durio zibethinus]
MASSALPPPLSPPSTNATATNNNPSHFIISSPPPNPTLKTPTIRSRLSKICQQGQPHLARQLFDTIPQPTTVLWNTIIIGYICNNMPQEALLFYSHMKNSFPHTKCDSYTYSSVLKACTLSRNLRIGKAVHCHFIRGLTNPSRIVYNALLNFYATCLSSMDNKEMGGYSKGFDYLKHDLVCKVFNMMRKRDVVAWNTMISWYVKTERYLEAVMLFRNMMKTGKRLSGVSFVNVFPALSGLEDYNNAEVLYGMLLKLGSEFVGDLFVVSSSIFAFAELGCLDFARKIFDSCSQRNIEIWNTMIGGYLQNNCPVEGIKLFLQAIESETVFDDVTFLSALSAVSQLQRLDLAHQLHAYTIKNLHKLPVIVANAILVMYSRCNSINTSFEVFDKMPERDVISWNTMVSAFVQNGLDDEGLLLVYEMQKQGFLVDSVTVTALLSAASNLRNREIGKQTHAYLLRRGIQFEGMDSYIIDMYAKSGLIRNSQLLFENSNSSNRDQATWNAMIAGLAQNGLIEEAIVVIRQMLQQNVMPNAVTLASVLPACSLMGNIDLGKQLHGFSVRNLSDPNVFVGTALVDMYSKSGALILAENMFFNIPEKNSVTYATMILGYAQHGMCEQALSLFRLMQASSIQPDAITFVAVLSACGYAGLVDEGLYIFKSMEREFNIQPSTEHYCCVADMLGKIGRVDEAYEFVKQLGEECNSLEIWGSLLAACRLHQKSDLGEVVAKKLLQMDIGKSTIGYHVLLSNMYAEEGNWKNVYRVRKELKEKGMRKDVGCSWIEVAGCVNYFSSKDQDHPQSNKIYELLEGLPRK